MIKKGLAAAAVATLVVGGSVGAQSARDYIFIVGSSTVYPFATVVAENFEAAANIAGVYAIATHAFLPREKTRLVSAGPARFLPGALQPLSRLRTCAQYTHFFLNGGVLEYEPVWP